MGSFSYEVGMEEVIFTLLCFFFFSVSIRPATMGEEWSFENLQQNLQSKQDRLGEGLFFIPRISASYS